MWIDNRIDHSFILDFHHSSSKLKSRDSFFNMSFLALHVSNHYSLAVSTNWVSQVISECSLSIWNMISLSVGESEYHLLEIGKTLVNMSSLNELTASCMSLLGSLRSSQINKMQFWVDHLFSWFNSGSRFNIDRVDTMRSWWMWIQLMCSIISINFTFK